MIHPKSIIIILLYAVMNIAVIVSAQLQDSSVDVDDEIEKVTAPEYTEIFNLNYFHLKNAEPQMSLSSDKMKSQDDSFAEFESPRGIYNLSAKKKIVKYEAQEGSYQKAKNLLILKDDVKISADEGEYLAQKINYYLSKDLIKASGGVKFDGIDPRSKDRILIESQSMEANPDKQLSTFKGSVKGEMLRQKRYEGKLEFKSQQLQLDGINSKARLEGDVQLRRQSYLITAGNGDIYLENFNKSLKYFVFNDDVKVTEKLQTAEGVSFRKAYAERLEGFGQEQKMVLSGAPKVEQGKDVVKGYRITIRENMDLIEVDDAMSDMQIKKEKKN